MMVWAERSGLPAAEGKTAMREPLPPASFEYAEWKVAKVHCHCRDRWTRGRNGRQQSPVAEPLRAKPVDEVPVRNITGKPRAIDEQHSTATPRREHGGRRSGTTRADDDDVVHVSPRIGLTPSDDLRRDRLDQLINEAVWRPTAFDDEMSPD